MGRIAEEGLGGEDDRHAQTRIALFGLRVELVGPFLVGGQFVERAAVEQLELVDERRRGRQTGLAVTAVGGARRRCT